MLSSAFLKNLSQYLFDRTQKNLVQNVRNVKVAHNLKKWQYAKNPKLSLDFGYHVKGSKLGYSVHAVFSKMCCGYVKLMKKQIIKQLHKYPLTTKYSKLTISKWLAESNRNNFGVYGPNRVSPVLLKVCKNVSDTHAVTR